MASPGASIHPRQVSQKKFLALSRDLCFYSLMFDAATEPVAAVQPDPHRAVPEHVGKVLGVVRTLIAHGQNLTETLRRHADDPRAIPCFAFVAWIFGTGDLARILSRLARGLLRALALEDRLRQHAASGRDLKPTPLRLPSPRKPRVAKPATLAGAPAEDLCPARAPTTEEILAKDRRRPIGAVLVEICLDLGILPGHLDPATWHELRRQIIEYGGSLPTLVLRRQACRRFADPTEESPSPTGDPSFAPIAEPTTEFPEWAAPSPKSPVPACTGPP